MKTVREWLKTLPGPWQTAALTQIDETLECNMKRQLVPTLQVAVGSFNFWHLTKEGGARWVDVFRASVNNTPYPKYPKESELNADDK